MLDHQQGPDADMVVTLNLSREWRRAVGADLIRAQCQFDDGRRTTWGVMEQDDQLIFYQQDGTASKRPTDIESRELARGLSLAFHPFRPFRPGATRPMPGRQKDLSAEVMACQFGCQDPRRSQSLLGCPALAQVPCPHSTWHAYSNAAPFDADGHFIWVPGLANGVNVVLPHLPQRLTREALADFIFLSPAIVNALIFFNAAHAGASAYHLHFQSVTHRGALAIEMAPRLATAGLTMLDYAASALVFEQATTPDRIWPMIDRLQQRSIPFNLIGIGETLYLIPRNPEHEVVDEFPGGVLASMELVGRGITGDRAVYEAMTGETYARALRKTTLPPAAVADLVRDL
jgi:hypothetical protein